MSLRKWFVRGLVALVIAGCVGAGVVYQQWTNPAAVRQQVVDLLERQFPGANVTLDGARLRLFGGVVLTELRLLRRGENDADLADVLHIPQATVYHDKERLLEGQFAVRRIEMQRPRVHIVRTRDGKWNLDGLTGKSPSGGPLPTVVIHQGTLIIDDRFAGPVIWEIHDLNLTLVSDAPNRVSFGGTGQSETFGSMEVRGSWDRSTNAVTLAFKTTELALTRDLVHYVAAQCPDQRLAGLQLEGRADLQVNLSYQPGATPALRPDIKCQLRQITVNHPDLPSPLHNLTASLHCADGKLTLERLKAAAGVGKVECKGWADLANPQDTFAGELTASYLPLTKDLADKLPPGVRRLHELFQPVGAAKIQFFAEKQNGQWLRKHCTLEPDEISVCFKNFRYPIDRLTGIMDYDFLTQTSKFDAVGYTGTQPLTIRGNWKGTGIDSDAFIEIAGKDIPLDSKLLDALTPNIQRQALSFHPVGRGHFRGIIRRVPGCLDYQSIYHVHFVDCNILWDEFRYALEKVNGDLFIYPRYYEFKDFHGMHGGGEVFVRGQTTPPAEGRDSKLLVNILGKNLAIDDDLRTALKPFPGLIKTWDTFSPAGRLNFQSQVEQVAGQPHDLDITVDVAGCSIEPSFFRYHMHDVAGQFRYHKNKVELTNFTARHNNSLLSIDRGTVDLYPRGGFYVELNDLRANPMLADPDLLTALPQALRTTAEAINLKGQPFAMQTKMVVSASGEPGTPPEIFWDGQLWVQDADLKAGIDLNHVTGTVACRGLHNGRQLVGLCGNIYLDQATVFKQPVNGVRTHFAVREGAPDVLLFGMRAPLFGGDVTGQGRLEFNSLFRYEVDLTASQISLEDFGQHNLGPKHQLAGIAAGRLHLQGQGAGVKELEGNGSLDVPYSPLTRLLNMPLLLDLLKFLGLRWPDRTAFEEAHMVYAIHGNRVSISKLDLLGNVVSLYGKGEVNLDGTDLDLEMYPSWGRAEQMLPSSVRTIPSAISKQLVKVEVTGKVGGGEDDLKFSKRLVPGLTDPLLRMMGKGN
jgi:hypothetical protein